MPSSFSTTIDPIQKQAALLRNLKASGDIEPGSEGFQERESDEVQEIIFQSAEDLAKYTKKINSDWKGYLENVGSTDQVYRDSIADTVTLAENKPESQTTFLSGERKSISFNAEKETVKVEEVKLKAEPKSEVIKESLAKGTSTVSEIGAKVDFKLLGGFVKEKTFSFFKDIFGVFGSLFKEVRGGKVKAPETDEAKLKKKQKEEEKKRNIASFNEALRAQAAPLANSEMKRASRQEAININTVGKIGNELYQGIKDSYGRLTVYAQTLFEKGQIEQENKAKKAEKESKIAQATGGKGGFSGQMQDFAEKGSGGHWMANPG